MNKKRFIERLNLHLDGELSAEESSNLLEAVRRNPEYHRIYLQYCQIYSACSRLGDNFVKTRPVTAWRQKAYAIGGMAAALALLGLAAQNLTPFIGKTPEAALLAQNSAEGVNAGVSSMPLPVLDVNELDRREILTDNVSLRTVRYDMDRLFELEDDIPAFSSPANVEFASFSVADTNRPDNVWQREFAFGSAVQASTFEHEALTADEEEAQAFSVRTLGSASDEMRAAQVRFDLRRAAAVAGAESRK